MHLSAGQGSNRFVWGRFSGARGVVGVWERWFVEDGRESGGVGKVVLGFCWSEGSFSG